MVNLRGPNGKIVIDGYRQEIEERTIAGESCEGIAAALRDTYRVDISSKTVSRKRVQWGLRQRAVRKTNPASEARRVARRQAAQPSLELLAKRNKTKDDIAARTQRGETAERIAAELTAQGVKFNKGASTVLRLQTFWGLIPYERGRANGKKGKLTPDRLKALEEQEAAKKAAKAAAREALKQGIKKSKEAAKQNGELIHYLGNCNAGSGQLPSDLAPHAPVTQQDGDEHNPINIQPGLDESDDDEYEPLPPMDDAVPQQETEDASPHQLHGSQTAQQHNLQYSQPTQHPHPPQHLHHPQQRQPTQQQQALSQRRPQQLQPLQPRPQINYSRDLMSANLMIDLATSMLNAARDVKEKLVAAQQPRAAHRVISLQPGPQEVTMARRKLKEATRCAWDLAKDGVLDDV